MVVNYRGQREAAEATVAEIGGNAIAVQADVADADAVARLVGTTLQRLGRIDVLVNNAGIMHRSDVFHYNPSEAERMWKTNVGGVTNCVAAVAEPMKTQRSGSIVNLTSIAAHGTAMQGTTFYAATKAAVAILTKRFALELGPFGVNVNAVSPGFIVTDMVAVGRTPEELRQALETLAARAMLGRTGTPEDIASVVAFLASPDAGFVTGQILTADGGRTDFLTHGL